MDEKLKSDAKPEENPAEKPKVETTIETAPELPAEVTKATAKPTGKKPQSVEVKVAEAPLKPAAPVQALPKRTLDEMAAGRRRLEERYGKPR